MRRKNSKMEGEVALPFRQANASIFSYATDMQRKTAFFGGICLALLVVVYLYGVITSVMHVANNEELSIEITRLSSEVAKLEAEYLTRTDGITESFALERGYVAISERVFVERAAGITLNSTR
jgi:hypothetical protein